MSQVSSLTIVNVGLWNQAPFKYAVETCVQKLNSYLSSHDLPVQYNVDYLDHKKLPKICPDILFLDGGEDIDPARYGEKNHFSNFSERRDDAEFHLCEWFHSNKKRISGVCRGHQLINVFFGGSLYQDIREDLKQRYNIEVKHPSPHDVRLTGWSKSKSSPSSLNRFVGNTRFDVSSLHHQAIRFLPPSVRRTLIWDIDCDDEHVEPLVEGIESKCGRYRGVQSHPEFRGHSKDGLLFSYLMHVDRFIAPFMDQVENPSLASILNKKDKEKMENQYFIRRDYDGDEERVLVQGPSSRGHNNNIDWRIIENATTESD